MDSLRAKSIEGILWSFLQRFGFQGVNFIVQILLARVLTPQEFGIIAILQIFISIGNRLMDGGMTSSLIRTQNPDKRDFSTVFYINIATSVLLYVVIYFAAPYISRFYHLPLLESVIRVFALSFVIRALVGVQEAIYIKAMKFKQQMMMQLPSVVVGGATSIFMAHNGWGVWSLVGFNLVQAFCYMVQFWIRSDWKPSLIFSKRKVGYHFNFGYKLMLSHLINAIYDNIYNVFIGKFFSVFQAGLYNRAETFQTFPGRNIGSALEKVTYPMFSSISNDDIKLRRAYKKTLQIIFFGMVPLIVTCSVLAVPIFRFFLTSTWVPAAEYFQLLAVVGILTPLHRYNLSILRVKGRTDLILRITIIKRIILTIILLITGSIGIKALIIGQTIYALIAFCCNAYYSGQYIKYSVSCQLFDMLPVFIIGLVTGGLVLLVDLQIHNYGDLTRIFVGVCTSTLVYIGISFLFKIESFNDLKKIVLSGIKRFRK